MKTSLEHLRTAIKAVLPFADKVRHHLSSVLLAQEGESLAIVATDGHRIARVCIPAEFGGRFGWIPISIEAGEAKRLAANLDRQPEQELEVSRGAAALTPTSLTLAVQVGRFGSFHSPIDAEPFPPYLKVIPRVWEGAVVRVHTLNASYLASACKLFNAVHGRGAHVRCYPVSNELDPVRFDATSEDRDVRSTVVIMPLRS